MNKLSKEVLTEVEVIYIPKEAIMSPLISQAKVLLTEYNLNCIELPNHQGKYSASVVLWLIHSFDSFKYLFSSPLCLHEQFKFN